MPEDFLQLWNTSQPVEPARHWPSRSAGRMARNLAKAACDTRRADVVALIDQGVRFFRACKEAGVHPDFLDDTIPRFRDQASNLAHAIDTDLDNAGACSDEKVSMAEIDAMIGRGER